MRGQRGRRSYDKGEEEDGNDNAKTTSTMRVTNPCRVQEWDIVITVTVVAVVAPEGGGNGYIAIVNDVFLVRR